MKRGNGKGSVYWVAARKRWAVAVTLPGEKRRVVYFLTQEAALAQLRLLLTPVETAEQHFWRYVEKTDACWLWHGRMTNRYGQPMLGGSLVLAHRFAWELHNGAIPEGMCVCHHCDTPVCVRPEHLFLGTAADNAADMVAKGRNFDERDASGRYVASSGC